MSLHEIADSYAAGTETAWEREMAAETADEERAERETAAWAARAHKPVPGPVRGFCGRCDRNLENHP